nr:unnamed protein product [Digitaria exilis]
MEFDFDSLDGGDAWLLDAMATSLHFSAASPPLPPPWPCGDHPSVPLDAAAPHPQVDAPGAPAGEAFSDPAIDFAFPFFTTPCGKSEITKKGEPISGKCQVHLSMVDEYSDSSYFLKERLTLALSYNVHGTVALPVFDPYKKSCIAVVELIMTSKKVNYASEVGKVCRALEAVNLKSTEVVEQPYVQICNEGHQAALVEMLEILTVIVEELKLPLAQTWSTICRKDKEFLERHSSYTGLAFQKIMSYNNEAHLQATRDFSLAIAANQKV